MTESVTQPDYGSSRLYDGTELELSIVKGLLDLISGEIWLESETGIGTAYDFSFPYMYAIIKEERIASSDLNLILFPARKVLIVEDDDYNAEYLKEVLLDSGLKLLHAVTGKEALTILNENLVDLVLMDIRLPDMSGYDVIREIRKTKPALTIIAQTAYASDSDQQKALEVGCNDYMSKPIKPSTLISKIGYYLSE